MGRRRRGHADDLHRHRRDDVACGFPSADSSGHRLVAQRHIDGRHPRFPVHGCRRLLVGHDVRPLRHAPCRAAWKRAPRPWPHWREPRADAPRVPAAVRRGRRRGRRQLLCADDGGRNPVARASPQPRGCTRLGRHGHWVHDGLAARWLAAADLRLAYCHAGHRHHSLGAAHSGRPAGAPATRGGTSHRSRRSPHPVRLRTIR